MRFMRPFRSIAAMLAAALALLAAAGFAHAQTFPKLTGRVVDTANLLSPEQEKAIDAKLAALEQQSQRQLVVVTIADLGGYDIADYGFRLGDHWGIGDKERDDGALLIVAPNERKMRIEVGYGLEGVLPDVLAGRIIRNDIVPRFKANDYPGGIAAGVDAIAKQLTLPPDQAKKVVQEAQQAHSSDSGNAGTLFFILFILFFFVLPMLLRGRAGRAYRRGAAPVVLWGPMIGGGFGGSHHRGGGWSGGGFSGGGGGFGGGGASGGW